MAFYDYIPLMIIVNCLRRVCAFILNATERDFKHKFENTRVGCFVELYVSKRTVCIVSTAILLEDKTQSFKSFRCICICSYFSRFDLKTSQLRKVTYKFSAVCWQTDIIRRVSSLLSLYFYLSRLYCCRKRCMLCVVYSTYFNAIMIYETRFEHLGYNVTQTA